MRIYLMAICSALLLVTLVSLTGCAGILSNNWTESRTTTSGFGIASLNYTSGTSWQESLSVYDTVTNGHLNNIQVLGLSNSTDTAYLAVDPDYYYYPSLVTDKSNTSNAIYMSPVGSTTRADVHEDSMNTATLSAFTSFYELKSYSTTVAGLKAEIASLSLNAANIGMFVVCANFPLNSSNININTTSVAYRNTSTARLQTAIDAVRWDSIYSSAGYTGSQNLKVTILDRASIDITNVPGNTGVLADSLIAIVSPDSNDNIPPTPGIKSLRVDLGWNKPVDLDLHLIRNNPPVYHDLYDTVNDCFWQPNVLDWGVIGNTNDNPQFVRDSRDGSITEEIYLEKMTAGDSYAVAIDYWGDPYQNATHVAVSGTVYVYINGSSTPIVINSTELTYGEPWGSSPQGFTNVCDINGTTGAVVERTLARSLQQRPAFRSGIPVLRKK